MAIGRYFKPVPLTFELSTSPTEYLAAALEQQQKKFDTNLAVAEKLKNQYIDALPQDRARANAIQQDIASKVDNMVSAYDGDYSRVTKDLYRLTSDIERSLRPGGEGYAISSNFKSFQDRAKAEQERLAKGEITSQQYNLWQNYTLNNYAGALMDPKTNAYKTLSPEPIASYFDSQKMFEETVKNIPTRKTLVSGPTGETDGRGNLILKEEYKEYRDPNQTSQTFLSNFRSSPQANAYLEQIARFNGVDSQEFIGNTLSDFLQNKVPAVTGILDRRDEVDLKEDPYQQHLWAMQRDANKEELSFRYKKRFKMFEQELAAPQDTGVHVLTTTQQFNPYKKVSEEIEFEFTNTSSWGKSGSPQTVDNLIREGKVDTQLMNTIKAANPNLSDRAIIGLYNENIGAGTRFGSEVYFYPFKASATAKEELARIIPRAQSLQVPILEIDPKTGKKQMLESAEQREEAVKGFTDEKGNILASALGKSSIQTGGMPYGTVVQANGKYYVISETDLRIRDQINDDTQGGMGHRAFSFIDKPGQNQGLPFQISEAGEDGKIQSYTVAGEKYYEWDNTSKRVVPQVKYYEVDMEQDGKYKINKDKPLYEEDPTTKQRRYLTPADIEASYILPARVRMGTMPINTRSKDKTTNTLLE
jgi:hypothetical protein